MIELIIVLAIIGFFIGGMVTFMGVVPRTQVRGAAENIMSNMSTARTEATSFFEANVSFSVQNNQIFADISHRGQKDATPTVEHERVSERDVNIYVFVKTKEKPYKLKEGNSVVINYNRATGGFRTSTVSASENVNDIVTKIVVEKGGYRSEISLSELSGRLIGGDVTKETVSMAEEYGL